MKKEQYRGFEIEADEYLGYGKYFWSVYAANGIEMGSTLWHDDKPYQNIEDAVAGAKTALDEMLACGDRGYFATGLLFNPKTN